MRCCFQRLSTSAPRTLTLRPVGTISNHERGPRDHGRAHDATSRGSLPCRLHLDVVSGLTATRPGGSTRSRRSTRGASGCPATRLSPGCSSTGLIPRVVPGLSVGDLAVGRADTTRLDELGPARLRLDSTVVGVRHAGGTVRAAEAVVSYARGDRLERVCARTTCWPRGLDDDTVFCACRELDELPSSTRARAPSSSREHRIGTDDERLRDCRA